MENLNNQISEEIKEVLFQENYNNGKRILLRRQSGGETSLKHFKSIKDKNMVLRRKVGIKLIDFFLNGSQKLTKEQFKLFSKSRGVTISVANIIKQDLSCYTTDTGRKEYPKRINIELDRILLGIDINQKNHKIRKEYKNEN